MKKRTLNEYRQTKEYQGSEEGRKYLDNLETPSKSFIEDQEAAKQLAEKEPEEIEEIRNKLNYTLNEQMQEIAGIVAPTINDVIFNEIIEVMDNYDELNWGYFVQDDAPTALLDACFEHKQKIHYKIFQLVLKEL
tara:strand:+ start:430 stop:834 length:405 start_codon:yes stop_codon:yes gene_type:complete